jgi:phosphatidate cytidylyltransferase
VSELTKRILFAAPAAAFFLYITYVGGFYFTGLVILLSLLIQYELMGITEGAGFKADTYFPYTIGLWILLSPYLSHVLIIGLGIFLLFVAIQLFKPGDVGLKSLGSTFFCGIYAPLGMLSLILVRQIGDSETGFLLTMTLLLMIWGNDIFAYFGGKQFGKRPLAPKISPNKTWEGFFFGIAGALVGLLIGAYAIPIDFPVSVLLMLPVVILVSIFGPIGDLTESRLKRAASLKDASKILPGHGGFFDRFDALILAAPVFYCYLQLIVIFGYASF